MAIKKRTSAKAFGERWKKAAKIQTLAERGDTPGERQAAEAALERLDVTPDEVMWGKLTLDVEERKQRLRQARQRTPAPQPDDSDIEVIEVIKTNRPKAKKAKAKASVRRNLTEKGVIKYKAPKDRQFDSYYDAVVPGLVLRVNAGGKKTWCALYYVPTVAKKGKKEGQRISMPILHRLGTFPILTVKKAREKARQFLADPHKALSQADSGSFKEVAEDFIKRHVEANKLRTRDAIVYHLEKYVYPEWQHKPFRELRRGDVTTLLDHIEDRNGARNADMCLAIIRKMMNWYQSRNDDYVTAVVKGMGRYSPKDHKRKRILFKSLGNGQHDDAELVAFWNACRASNAATFSALLKTLLFSGQRLDKVATMKRADISEDGVWTIASELREKSNAGSLRLPQAAIDIIAAQPRIEGNPFVFPGSRLGRRKSKDGKPNKTPPAPPAFNSFSEAKEAFDLLMLNELQKIAEARNDSAKLVFVAKVRALLEAHAAAKGEAKKELRRQIKKIWWVLHDLRRTAKSLMQRAGVRPDISERVLGHAIQGVEGTYDQHTYDTEKADALQRLADLIETILNPPSDNVVPLRAR